MTEEHEEDEPTPRRGNPIIRWLIGSPRNVFLTVGTVFILYSMATNTQRHREYRQSLKGENTANTIPSTPDAEDTENYPSVFNPAPAETKNTPAESPKAESKPAEIPTPAPAAPLSPAPEPAVNTATLTEITRTHDQLVALEQKLADQQKTIDSLSQQLRDVAALREKIETTQTRSNDRIATITLFSQLRDAAAHGEPFKPQLDQLLELNKNDAKVNALLIQLLPAAPTGITSPEELQKQFATSLAAILGRDNGDSFATNLKKLIRIRKIGANQPGMDDESILARAEAAVNAKEFAPALKTLEALSPEAKKLINPWIHHTQEYINTQNTLASLQLALANPAPITAPPAAPPEPAKPVTIPQEKPAETPAAPAKADISPEKKPAEQKEEPADTPDNTDSDKAAE